MISSGKTSTLFIELERVKIKCYVLYFSIPEYHTDKHVTCDGETILITNITARNDSVAC